jgi:uncharacterized protein with HEPN domain
VKYSDEQRLEKIAVTTEKLLAYLSQEKITAEDVLAQEPLRWAITTPLYNIGEQAYQLSDGFKTAHPDIPWAKISGLRHRLVHDYDNTNWSLICTILFDVLPDFLESVHDLQNQLRPKP